MADAFTAYFAGVADSGTVLPPVTADNGCRPRKSMMLLPVSVEKVARVKGSLKPKRSTDVDGIST